MAETPRSRTAWIAAEVGAFVSVSVTLGDCMAVLAARDGPLFDCCVTDPPYHLTSMSKPRPDLDGKNNQFARRQAQMSTGFMGKEWDGGDIAFRPELWRAVYDQMKPGAHLIAFSGTRTYHRMACAIEDAGFEIRDQLQWIYGSGFPKSHDVSKGIDKAAVAAPLFDTIRAHVRQWRDTRGHSNKSLNEALGLETNGCGMARHWTSTEGGQHMIPSKDQWLNLKRALDWPNCELDSIYVAVKDGAARPKLGERNANKLAVAPGQGNDRSATVLDITAPATDEARQWQGWGSSLKPAHEPICLARKPLSEKSIAANVVKHGTGAINVDACRVEGGDASEGRSRHGGGTMQGSSFQMPDSISSMPAGRWPANILHDGSDEVTAGFPETHGAGSARDGSSNPRQQNWSGNVANAPSERSTGDMHRLGDSGSAARFFYSAKAGPLDRLGSPHPTVKPVDVMRWLVRLVTPPGGLILDPFAGSGTTGIAAMAEGFDCELIDLMPDHVADIERKLAFLRGEGRLTVQEHINGREARKDASASALPILDWLAA